MRTGLPKRTETSCALPSDSALARCSWSRPIHHPHPGGILLTETATVPAARSLAFREETMSFSASADLVPWHGKSPSERKSRTGLRSQQRCSSEGPVLPEQFRPDPCLPQSRCSLTRDDGRNWHEDGVPGMQGAATRVGLGIFSRNFMHVTGVRLSLELRVRHAGREKEDISRSGEDEVSAQKRRGSNAPGLSAWSKNQHEKHYLRDAAFCVPHLIRGAHQPISLKQCDSQSRPH